MALVDSVCLHVVLFKKVGPRPQVSQGGTPHRHIAIDAPVILHRSWYDPHGKRGFS